MPSDVAVYNIVQRINQQPGKRLSRVMAKLYFGQPVTITSLGDSVLEGTTVTSGGGVLGTDDCLSLVRTALAAAYPAATVTMNNRAQSGNTMAMQIKRAWATALADNADVYILSSGKNELAAYSLSAPGTLEGQSNASSWAMLEAKIAELRATHPTAAIIVMADNPYSAASTTLNGYQVLWDAGAEQIAYRYGCEFVDGYRAFTRLGSYDSLLSDGVHPNKAGHALLGATLKAVFPLAWTPDYAKRQDARALSPSSTYPGLPDVTDRVSLPWRHNRNGLQALTAIVGTNYAAKMLKVGAVNGVGADHFTGTGPYTTTTAGDAVIFTLPGNEAFLDLVMGSGQGVVAFYIDGAPLKFNGALVGNVDLSLRANGKLIHFTDQCGMGKLGWHTVAVALVSGSLTVNGGYYTQGRSQFINWDSPSVVAASMGSSTSLGSAPGGTAIASANGGSLTCKFVGTGIGFCWWRSTTGGVAYYAHPTIDGIDQGAMSLGNLDSNQIGYGSQIIGASGLAYGLHTLVLNFQATGIYTAGFYPIDEQAVTRPGQLDGWAGASEVVKFGEAFPAIPTMTGDAGVTFGSLTTAGFTNGATPGQWKAVAADTTAANALLY